MQTYSHLINPDGSQHSSPETSADLFEPVRE